jgi:hypothetical protein
LPKIGWLDLKVMEEKALEGRRPTRVRFGDRALASAGPLRRIRRTCGCFGWSFPFPEAKTGGSTSVDLATNRGYG